MKLAGKLPKEQLNGLASVLSEMTKKPTEGHLVIAYVDAEEVSVYPRDDVKVEIQRIEVVPEEYQVMIANLLEQVFETRTGSTRLDLGFPDELDLRQRFDKSAKKPRRKPRNAPDLSQEPAAIEPKRREIAPPEDIIDAEVVDDESPEDAVPEEPTDDTATDDADPGSGLDDDEVQPDTPDDQE